MIQPVEVLRKSVAAAREWVAAVTGQTERTTLLAAVLIASTVSLAVGFVLTRFYDIDVLSSLIVAIPFDCQMAWPTRIGNHCFSDHLLPVTIGMVPNPWDPYPLYLPPDFKPTHFNYTAAGMVPHVVFGLLGKSLGAPSFGMFAYLAVLSVAVLTPAVWAARGATGLERVVVFFVLGVAAIPVWMVLERGNSVGFIAPVGLAFLIGLCKRRWAYVAVMVILASFVKPQFALLVVALFAARQWRIGGMTVAGVAIVNLAAYAFWPRDFPRTIGQSIQNATNYGGVTKAVVEGSNMSFSKALLGIPDMIKASQSGGQIPLDFLAGPRALLGYLVALIVAVLLVTFGRRIPPVMAGITLLAAASLSPPLSNPYYMVFVLPVAAVLVRDPEGSTATGLFDRLKAGGDARRVVGVCVSVASALCIAQIPLPTTKHTIVENGKDVPSILVDSTVTLGPVVWLTVLIVIFGSYVRRPALSGGDADVRGQNGTGDPSPREPVHTSLSSPNSAPEPDLDDHPQTHP